jgi:hypothetical protein
MIRPEILGKVCLTCLVIRCILSTFVRLQILLTMKKILLLAAAGAFSTALLAQNNCADIFISEYVEGTFNNKAIELYNPTTQPIVLDGAYSMGRDRDGAGVPMLIDLTGTIQPFGVRVFVLDKRDTSGTGNEVAVWPELQAEADTFLNPVYVQSNSPMYFNGDDAFVLVKNGNQILDIIGEIGFDPGDGWWQPGDPNTRWWTVDNTLIRKQTTLRGVTTNPAEFDPSLEWDSLPVNTFTELGEHLCDCQSLSIQNDNYSSGFTVFPNPVLDNHFALQSANRIASFRLMSTDGRLLEEQKLNDVLYANITLPQAQAGVYYLEVVFTDGKKSVQKILSR